MVSWFPENDYFELQNAEGNYVTLRSKTQKDVSFRVPVYDVRRLLQGIRDNEACLPFRIQLDRRKDTYFIEYGVSRSCVSLTVEQYGDLRALLQRHS